MASPSGAYICTNPALKTLSMSEPPTNLAYFAVGFVANVSTTMSSCCQSPPANYDSPNEFGIPSSCFSYCNVTAPGLTHDAVRECVKKILDNDHFEGTGYLSIFGNATDDKEEKKPESGAVTFKSMGVMGYLVLGLGFAGAFGMV